MFFPLRSNLPTSPFTAAHHASRLALTLMASLLLAACGSSTPAPATPTPTPLLAPNLGTVSAQTYTQDTDITPLVFDNSGGDAASCTIGNPGLPTGLNVRVFPDNGKRTCRITGAPMEVVSPARMVTITATNTAGSDTATVSIIVNPAATLIAPTNLAPLVSGSQSPGEGIVIASNGVALMQNSCVFSSSGQTSQTLDGLKLITDASGCRITGTPTPTASATSRSYTILAVSVNGDDLEIMITLMVLPAPAAPDLPDGAVTALVVDGASVGTVTIANTGDNPDTCQFVDPAGDTDATLVSTLDGISVTVATNNTDCEITGALTGTGTKEFTVRATNATDSDNATVQFTVNPVAPNLSDASAQTYTQNTAITPLVFANSGGDVTASTGCAVDTSDSKPNLPAGLSVEVVTDNGKMTCQIFGTPMEVVSTARMVTITATNITGSDSATASIAVTLAAPNLSGVSTLTYTQNIAITPLVLTNTGSGELMGCSASSSLPSGLSVTTNTGNDSCVITGTPDTVTPAANYDITATNDTGSSTITVSITVNPAAPKLSSVNAQVYTPNTDITPLVFTNTGGDVTNDATGCTASISGGKPDLPTGLDVEVVIVDDKRTCRITDMPTELVNPARMVTITATNITGSDTVTVPITVSSGIVPDSLSGQNLFRYEAGRTVPDTRQITFTNTSSAITSCTVPDMIDGLPNGLPEGMSISPTNCTISGEPSRIMAQTTTHTITAMHMDDTTSTATISIETYLSAPPSLSDYSRVSLVTGSAAGLPIVLENTGGLVGENGCQVASDNAEGTETLRKFGLELAVTADSSSCEIKAVDTGPTITLLIGRYSISATNDVGISGAIATIIIASDRDGVPAPTLTAPNPSSFTFATNEAIDSINFTIGGAIGVCTISEALPAGLRLNPSTCQITGTPVEAVSPARTVTITATNAAGSASADISITVTNAAAPALESMIDLNLTMNSNVGLPFAIANTGGNPTDCAAAPTTTDDDDLDSYNLTVLVADGTCVIDSRDGNGPSRTLDGGSFTITASGTPASAATLTLNLRSPTTPHIATGNTRTYAINAAGQLFGWGNNFENQLGLGDLDAALSPISAPTPLTGNDWEQVDSGRDHTCAINVSGQLFCWGSGGSGQLGLGNNTATNAPTQVGMVSDWAQVSAGAFYTCAINASRQLFCWGDGDNGQLGLGDNDNRDTPTQVGMARNWMQVSSGSDYTCAINVSRQLFCWGLGSAGQLGLGDNDNRDTPTQVVMPVNSDQEDDDWMQVSSGSEHTCAIKTSGQLWCWGKGADGRLGLGDTILARTPARVGDAENWMQVSAGSEHTCAINTSGQLFCWGSGGSGRLGLGDPNIRNIPTQVDSANDWMQVSAGGEYTCAIKAAGELWCWGNSANGRLGLGNNINTNINTPMKLAGSASLTASTTVHSGIMPDSLAGQSLFRYEAGQAANREITFTNAGGTIELCTADLPPGMSINPANCTISGAPSRTTAEITAHTIRATYIDSATSVARISIETYLPIGPALRNYSGVTLVVGSTVGLPIVLENTGGPVGENGCQVSSDNALGERPLKNFGLELAVTADSSSCEIRAIVKAPTAAVEETVYNIRAINGESMSSLEASITIVDEDDDPLPAPTLMAPIPNSFTFTTNTAITPINFTLRDGGLGICTINRVLPAGLRLDPSTCQISGTPRAVLTTMTIYTVTAINATGRSSATVSIIVNLAAPRLSAVDAQVYVVESTIPNLVLTNTGGDVTASTGCTVDTSGGNPGLPAGLDVVVVTDSDKRTCQITGTPTEAVSPARIVTITATNAGGQSSVMVSITVNPPDAPKLSGVNAQVYAANTTIDALVFTNTGGDVTASTGCTVAPALPAELSVAVATTSAGKRTCQIIGNPTTPVAATDYEITAANVTGSSSIIVSIIVSSGIVPDSLSGQALFRYEAGQTVPVTREITFTNFSGDVITSCAADLPPGMSINIADCAISGEPLRITAQTTPHTITAMYPDGTTSTATISIETYLSAPPSLSDYSGVTLVIGSAVGLPIVLENIGGLVGANGCQVASDNALGARSLSNFGLEVAVTTDSSSCEIRATNTAPTGVPVEGETGYSITATNDLGVSGATATLTIIGASQAVAAPILTAPIPSSFTFPTNTAITPIDFTISGGGLGICTISQALPDGLRFDPSTCQISGTPRTASAMTTYTVTATNKTSPAATADVAITVTDAAPALESMVTLGLTLNSNLGLPFAIANTGGSPTSCIVAPATAGDDALKSYNLAVTVADGTCVIDSLDGNGPSRVLDGGGFTITPSSGAASTLTLNLRAPATPQIVAGNDRTYAINSARQLSGWGDNSSNRLGLGNLEDFLFPALAPIPLTGNDWAQVSSGNDHTCAIKASGQLWCWGRGNSGRLGLGNSDNTDTPTRVGMASDWAQISAGAAHTCAINTSGHLFCWGLGNSGELGLGATDRANAPMQVGMASDWAQVSAGGGHTCAIKTTGELWCWGAALFGQLGIGPILGFNPFTNPNPSVNMPTRVGMAMDWAQVSTGGTHTCAINTSGHLFCWGFAFSGQLGLGNNTAMNIPTRVGMAMDWAQVSSGNSHTCVIKTAGELFCWGLGSAGQLGLGGNDDDDTIDSTNAPMQVGGTDGPSDWMQVSAGDEHTCAINTSGQPWCWGRGHRGQLGLDSYTKMSTPTRVPDFLLQ